MGMGIRWGPPGPKGPWIVLAVGVMIAVPVVYHFYQKAVSLEPFEKKLSVWLQEPAHSEPAAAYLRGKVLPVQRSAKEGRGRCVDEEFYWQLPGDMRADSPDEVDTVLWLEWQTEFLYEHRYPFSRCVGHILHCKVTIIDRVTSTKLASKSFKGGDPTKGPPEQRKNFVGPPPYPEILAYLKSLPTKER